MANVEHLERLKAAIDARIIQGQAHWDRKTYDAVHAHRSELSGTC